VTAAAFIDRDGVVNEPVWDPLTGSYESPYRPEDVALVPGAAEGLETLRAAGYALVLVSNQPAAAKGNVALTQLADVHERVVQELGFGFDGVYYCHHHPHGTVAGLSGPCDCRKPEPGLLLRAAEELELELAASWIVGDAETDVEAGRAAGVATALVEHPRTAHRRPGHAHPELVASDLAAAARAITARTTR
jgi:D-glycero-D-manno-heptose 1,7-bisphosphate phosphatase